MENFGFADNLMFIVLNSEDLNQGVEQLDKWCGQNWMETYTSKCILLFVIGSLTTTLSNVELGATNVQKDLGLMITPSHNWNDNCNKSDQKQPEFFFS